MTDSANVELVRSIFAAWERGDFTNTEWAHPEIDFVMFDGPSPGAWTGLAGMAMAWRGVLDAWEGYTSGTPSYQTVDDERVLVLSNQSGRGKASGFDLGQMQTKNATLFHIRDGKVARLIIYWDPDRAFADLGLTAESEAP